MRTTIQSTHFLTASSSLMKTLRLGSHEMSAGPYQINSTNIWPFRYVHCAFMASCMRWHSSSGDVQSCDIYFLFELTHVPLFICPFS